MRFKGNEIVIHEVAANAWNDISNNHAMTLAAGLAFYFVLSLFPLLILAATVLAFLPIPNLFNSVLAIMAQMIPPEGMGLVNSVAATVVQPHGGLLTFGLLGTLWAASSGFASLTEALNVAYDVPETRPYWKIRLLALGLMFVIGALIAAAIGLRLLGPVTARWMQNVLGIDPGLLLGFGPSIQRAISVGFSVIGIELMFYWAPNVKQRFWATLPGAVIGVGFFIGTSYALGIYFRHFAGFNRTYGTLGGAMALLVWLYYSWFAILVGAELNAEVLKIALHGKLELKGMPRSRACRIENPPPDTMSLSSGC